ncbi:TMEM165/GDT1 family protein [Pseudonocardia sp. HH130630-07]|uniref:TMEM165/GDT1 family protein n=1 Tax=Pseudonocardia sp. HH130630-07 TaxID=1690815 RepID=UPI0009F5A995|nr:TMEM165/GDT1 family protein [Pseudonocardia sp. HH130630-07]
MDGFLVAFAVSFGVIFVAELGDKSQLMALTFATRFKAIPVLIGITIATSVTHLVSVAVGYGLGASIPTGWISLVASVAFLVFGAWTLRGDSLTDDEERKAKRAGGSAVVAASMAFFLAELGDKTMLATITLATQYGWFGVWLGSTLGMVAADALAIVVGRKLGQKLPERVISIGAAVMFFVFGAWLFVEAVPQVFGEDAWAWFFGALGPWGTGGLVVAVGLLVTACAFWFRRRARRRAAVAGTAPAGEDQTRVG